MSLLTTNGKQFAIDGQETKLLSGAIHYFRVVPEYWEDRLIKLKACGLNTVETYVPWNLHEPKRGSYVFDGIADLQSFVALAAELDIRVVVRPGPFICSEWDFGGFPAWLHNIPGIKLRCYNKPYLECVDAWFDELLSRLVEMQSTRGGAIIAFQVENEYGSYGNDREYLEYLREGMVERGVEVPLFTSDGPTDRMLQSGTLQDVFKTVNFGSRATEAFEKLRVYQPDAPPMCMEFWNGWFDHWGEGHHVREPGDAAKALEEILECGASVNFYMFHGGTNFGFMNGANYGEEYQPTITSYDYDAPLDEAGNPTPKYFAFREVLSRYADETIPEVGPAVEAAALGTVPIAQYQDLFDIIGTLQPVTSVWPLTMEELDHYYGFVLYRTRVSGPRPANELKIQGLHDRALVFLNGEYRGPLYRTDGNASLAMEIPSSGGTLDILVENMGRINFGPKIGDLKGITGKVLLSNVSLSGWEHYLVPMEEVDTLFPSPAPAAGSAVSESPSGPVYCRFTLDVDSPTDTYLDMNGWGKGVVFLNGFNLGRYWEVGPQRTLYVPGPLLRPGKNSVVVFELHHAAATIEFVDAPVLGG